MRLLIGDMLPLTVGAALAFTLRRSGLLGRDWLPAVLARARLAAALAVLAIVVLLPEVVMAQAAGAGCSGTALTSIKGLDDLLATIWGYLMSGPLTKILAAALFVYGLFGLFEHRATPLVFGFSGAFIAAFAPTIIKAIFAGAGSGAASLCG